MSNASNGDLASLESAIRDGSPNDVVLARLHAALTKIVGFKVLTVQKLDLATLQSVRLYSSEPSYPIGGRASAGPREYEQAAELDFRSAVTTIPGALYPRHRRALTALPRVSLNGLFQSRRYMDVFGAPALFNLMGR